jgi:hypothetical protein
MTKVMKKEYTEQEKVFEDLSPIGEYEKEFGESKYKSILFPDETDEQPKQEQKDEKENEVVTEEETSEEASEENKENKE